MKFYPVYLLFLFLSISSQAQQISFGIKGGPSLVDVEVVANSEGIDSESQYLKMRPSYHLGVFGFVDLNRKFYLQAELLYANKGYRADYPRSSEANLHFHYLTIPVLLHYKIVEKLHGGLGATFGYMLAARSKSEGGNLDVSWRYNNKLDMGINVGAKYEISDKINLGIRYTYGLSNLFRERGVIIDVNGNPTTKGPKYQNRELQFSVGYAIGSAKFK